MILYKYLPPERIDVLKNKMIRFTQPRVLNDPFECRPKKYDIDDFGDKTKLDCCESSYIRGLQEQSIFEERKNLGILSLSECPENILMWSHYTNQHQGFIIGFDTNHDFFSQNKDCTILKKVKYSNKRPYYPIKRLIREIFNDSSSINDTVNILYRPEYIFNQNTSPIDYLFVKGNQWKYEKEWRFIKNLNNVSKVTVQTKDIDLPIYLIEIPPDCIHSVYIGCRSFSKLYRSIINIIESDSSLNKIKIYMTESDSDKFSINTIEFNPPKTFSNKLSIEDQIDYFISIGVLIAEDEAT